jgi:Tfp pilus assembly protein PilN
MKAVNLLPHDLRRAAKRASTAPEPAGGMGAYVVLGALALCVVALVGYVISTNAVKQRQADLDSVKARSAAVSKQVAALKPYADFDQMAQARVTTIKGLVAARFDWPQALGDLSRVVPSDVKLSSLTGTIRTGSGTASNPLRSQLGAPAVEVNGCARSQTGVAQLMSRLRNVDGVTRVSLAKSEKPTITAAPGATGSVGAGSGSTCGKAGPTFSVVAFFENNPAAAAYTTPTADATGAPPIPTAVEGGSGESGGTGTEAGTQASPSASATPAAGTSSSTSATTPTTPAP